MNDLSLKDARSLIAAGERHAARLTKPLAVTVVDAAGFTIATARMDGALPLTPAIAASKAYSAVVMRRASKELSGLSETHPQFFAQLSALAHQPILAVGGGLLIRRNGTVIGGLGVSGATADEDQAVAEAILTDAGFDPY